MLSINNAGYTGFVPRARPRLGMGYPIITHEALNEFTDDTNRLDNINKEAITLHRPEQPVRDSRLIYPTESGLVPHYTGHIPGKYTENGLVPQYTGHIPGRYTENVLVPHYTGHIRGKYTESCLVP